MSSSLKCQGRASRAARGASIYPTEYASAVFALFALAPRLV
ncbi:MAG: hypothetical protein QW057_09815 [Candidatus Bathyarchaeia archaeon]